MFDLLLKPWVATCHETGERLSDYLDGELDDRSLGRVRRHLHRCRRCQALLASLTRTIDQLRSLGPDERTEPSQTTVEAVAARIRREAL
jgi:anti-sigma factor RsiW